METRLEELGLIGKERSVDKMRCLLIKINNYFQWNLPSLFLQKSVLECYFVNWTWEGLRLPWIMWHLRSTLKWHLINSWLLVSQMSIDSYASMRLSADRWLRCWLSVRVSECQPRCWWSVNRVLIKCWSRASIKGIDQHSTADAFSAHDLLPLPSHSNQGGV